MVVADSSVLIVFAKIGKLGLLKLVFGSVTIAPSVKKEVVEGGLEIAAPDVVHVQQALEDGWIGVSRLTPAEQALRRRLTRTTTLGAGELDSLAIAKQRNLTVLLDDKEARTAARAIGVHPLGSAGVLFEAFTGGHLDLDSLDEAVRDLARVLWLSPDIVADISRRARGVKR